MELRDSRRLTGPNLLWEAPGAILDIALEAQEGEICVQTWRAQVRRMLAAVGWEDERTTHRMFPGGISLALSAPMDALYAATEINEWAWEAARKILSGEPEPRLETDAVRIGELIRVESNPPLLRLQHAARERGVAFLTDEDQVSVGLGTGSRTWKVDAIPDPEDVPWDAVHDIPVALVTGTNGKTTTVRLLASMAAHAGRCAGLSSTDWIQAGDRVIDRDDWSGPGGARKVLREPEIDLAILETARGGILRRGLAVEKADVALITNVAEDHLGEWGVHDISVLAETKFVVARSAGHVVLNADDPVSVEHARGLTRPVTWFSLDSRNSRIREHVAGGGRACVVENEALVLLRGPDRTEVARVDTIPITLSGAARHNVANALAAVATADVIGFSVEVMRNGLQDFAGTPEDNPGRFNHFDLGGARVVVDYAHNPHGVTAMFETAAALPARRRLVVLGQAGDREEESIRALARSAWRARPDRVVVKELTKHLRGRKPGEVPRILEEELRRMGAPDEAIERAPSELEAVRRSLLWAAPGDLLLLFCHDDRDAVIELLTRLRNAHWIPGTPLP